MQTLLRIDASVRSRDSYSRNLGDYFENLWRAKNPGSNIMKCDLATEQIPHIDHATIAAFFREDGQPGALALSNRLIKDLKACDVLLITSPMYNLNLPSTLKAWLDHVVRLNQTFTQSAEGAYSGLLQNKQAVIITSKGGLFKGTPQAHLDFQEPYLRAILYFIGISQVTFFSLEGASSKEHLENMIPGLRKEINHFLNN